MVRVFANGPGYLGSIIGRVIPKTQKWYLMSPFLTLSIIRYGSGVKFVNPGKGVAPSPTSWCCSYRIGSLQVTFDYSCQVYFCFFIASIYKIETLQLEIKLHQVSKNILKYIYIYIYIYEVYWDLYNGISASYGSIKAETWFTCKWLISNSPFEWL